MEFPECFDRDRRSLAGAETSRVRPVADDQRTPDGAQRPFHVGEGRVMVGIDEPAHGRCIQSQTDRRSGLQQLLALQVAPPAGAGVAAT